MAQIGVLCNYHAGGGVLRGACNLLDGDEMNAKEMIVNTVKANNAKAMVQILTEENRRLREENDLLRQIRDKQNETIKIKELENQLDSLEQKIENIGGE